MESKDEMQLETLERMRLEDDGAPPLPYEPPDPPLEVLGEEAICLK